MEKVKDLDGDYGKLGESIKAFHMDIGLLEVAGRALLQVCAH
jgi:hypothetical protein